MKRLLITLLSLGFFASTSLPEVNAADDVSMHCVGTCLGTFCNDKFADTQRAIAFIDAAENFCDAVNDLVN
ncbi:MAG: hypothetical protein ITG04_01745 [Proteiniphilum sp.]|nr:hypothetical protein [Proteiniphilum sp.]